MTSLEVSLPDPFDFELSTERYRAFGRDLANLWEDGALQRVIEGREARIGPAPSGVRIEHGDEALAEPARRYLGIAFDLDAFYAFAGTEPVLAAIAQRLRGFRPPIALDPWETLVTSITAQQVSLHAAFAIRNRLIQAFGEPFSRASAFPTRERVALADPEELFALGFSRRKADYAIGLARAGTDLEALALLPDDEVKAELIALPGIGEWTVDWFLARHLARPRAWPAGDLGLRKALAAFYCEGEDPTIEEARTMGERFDPFQNLSAHYLLTGLRVFV